jgi:hypothetical protein
MISTAVGRCSAILWGDDITGERRDGYDRCLLRFSSSDLVNELEMLPRSNNNVQHISYNHKICIYAPVAQSTGKFLIT